MKLYPLCIESLDKNKRLHTNGMLENKLLY